LSYAVVDSRSSQTFAEPASYAGFWLCDPRQKRIGMVEKLFVNWSGEPEYIRVSVGFFGFKSLCSRSRTSRLTSSVEYWCSSRELSYAEQRAGLAFGSLCSSETPNGLGNGMEAVFVL
jgi:hypothetical protein